MKKTTTTILLLFLCFTISALDFTFGVLSYTITSPTTVEVASLTDNSALGAPRKSSNFASRAKSTISQYTGDIIIPTTVSYNGVNYNVTGIGYKAFYNSDLLKSVSIPNSVTYVNGDAFSNCPGLTSITIPNSVTSLGIGAFNACVNLTSISLSQSLTNLPNLLFFFDIKLQSITIPSSVTSIGDDVFTTCQSLNSIVLQSTIPPTITTRTFFESSITSISVPVSSLTLYQNAPIWNTMINKISGFTTTKLDESTFSEYSINLVDKTILINKALEKNIKIFDIFGHLLFATSHSKDSERFTVNNKGTYIVSIDNNIKKIQVN